MSGAPTAGDGHGGVPGSIEIVYEPAAAGWTGACPALPGLRADGASFLAIDLQLGPAIGRALEARHGEPLTVSVTPGDAAPSGDGRHRRRLRVTPAYTPCTLQFMDWPPEA